MKYEKLLQTYKILTFSKTLAYAGSVVFMNKNWVLCCEKRNIDSAHPEKR